MNILAIDLGKFNSMCCFFDTDSQESRFQPAATARSYLDATNDRNEKHPRDVGQGNSRDDVFPH